MDDWRKGSNKLGNDVTVLDYILYTLLSQFSIEYERAMRLPIAYVEKMIKIHEAEMKELDKNVKSNSFS